MFAKIKWCNEDWDKHLLTQKMWRSGEVPMRVEMLTELYAYIKYLYVNNVKG